MKNVALKPFEGEIFQKNGIFTIKDAYYNFFGLKEFLASKKIQIDTIDLISNHKEIDKYIYCDVPFPWKKHTWYLIFHNKGKNVLFCFESPIINPFSHFKLIHKLFTKVYTWDDHLIDNKKYFKLYIPQLSTHISRESIPFKEKKLLVLINAKKSLPFFFKTLSGKKINLFNERLKAIEYFNEKASSDFSLFGGGWDHPDPFKPSERLFGFKKYKTYKGSIPNDGKIELLSQFKFSICFENTSANGYITEKIFDCFKARCVPIYWGAPNITTYINKNCFIDFREFVDYEKLLKYLRSISEKEYDSYIKNIDNFLYNPTTRAIWFQEGFKKTFLKAIID